MYCVDPVTNNLYDPIVVDKNNGWTIIVNLVFILTFN